VRIALASRRGDPTDTDVVLAGCSAGFAAIWAATLLLTTRVFRRKPSAERWLGEAAICTIVVPGALAGAFHARCPGSNEPSYTACASLIAMILGTLALWIARYRRTSA
jgi:hypothetical protein